MSKIESNPISMKTAADLSTRLFCFGKVGAGGVALCTVAGERADGVIGAYQKKTPASGDYIDFYNDRIVLVQSSAAIADGAELTPAVTTGKAVTAVSTNIVRAKALEAATAADQYIRALIVDAYVKP